MCQSPANRVDGYHQGLTKEPLTYQPEDPVVFSLSNHTFYHDHFVPKDTHRISMLEVNQEGVGVFLGVSLGANQQRDG